MQVLACARRLGLDEATLNADGGAIALGHPLGSAARRLVVTLLGRLEREQGRARPRDACASASARAPSLLRRAGLAAVVARSRRARRRRTR